MSPSEEVAKLRDAIRRAGFAVCQTSGDWTIHDVSEYAKQEEDRTTEIIMTNIKLERAVKAATALADEVLKDRDDAAEWVDDCGKFCRLAEAVRSSLR